MGDNRVKDLATIAREMHLGIENSYPREKLRRPLKALHSRYKTSA